MPSEFYVQVYRVVAQIPFGHLATYGQIAALAGRPGAARQVGYALHALPVGHDLPWHRVLNAQGKISMRDSHAAEKQRILLEGEGVLPTRSGRFDLKIYLWSP